MTNLYYLETSLLISGVVVGNAVAWLFVAAVLVIVAVLVVSPTSITGDIIAGQKEPISIGAGKGRHRDGC